MAICVALSSSFEGAIFRIPTTRQGFRAPLEMRLDYVSFDSSKSRSQKGPRSISSSCYPGKNALFCLRF